MVPVTPALLGALVHGGDPSLLAALAPELDAQLSAGGIDSVTRTAHFLAQAAFETWSFRRLEEDLRYRAGTIARQFPRLASRADALAMNPQALGNAAYAGKFGNGSEAGGDGYRYRGRGLLCLTFKANYDCIGKRIGRDLVATPDLVLRPSLAVASAIAFWDARHINEAADADDIDRVTRLVNGGSEGLADRMILKHRALSLLT